jgi:hypothetical protein
MRKHVKEILQYVFAALIVLCFFGILLLLFKYKIPTENTDTLNLALGALLAAFGAVVQYFFGSSSGSQRKTDIIAQQPPTPDEPCG